MTDGVRHGMSLPTVASDDVVVPAWTGRPLVLPRVLGVLGGMGPLATSGFLECVVRATPASRDQDHIPTMVWSDGRVPDRTEALLGQGPSPLPALTRGVQTLVLTGVDVIAVTCNTAHFYLPSLKRLTDLPFLNMV